MEGHKKDERSVERSPAAHGLLAALFAAVRPEWRREVIVAPDVNRLFVNGDCRVVDCGAVAYTRRGLCRAHNLRWVNAGRPTIEEWVATQEGPTLGRRALSRCQVTLCEFGRAQGGLCNRHHHLWRRAGKPPRDAWAAKVAHDPAVFADFPRCIVEGCDLLTTTNNQLCNSHYARLVRQIKAGQDPSVEAY